MCLDPSLPVAGRRMRGGGCLAQRRPQSAHRSTRVGRAVSWPRLQKAAHMSDNCFEAAAYRMLWALCRASIDILHHRAMAYSLATGYSVGTELLGSPCGHRGGGGGGGSAPSTCHGLMVCAYCPSLPHSTVTSTLLLYQKYTTAVLSQLTLEDNAVDGHTGVCVVGTCCCHHPQAEAGLRNFSNRHQERERERDQGEISCDPTYMPTIVTRIEIAGRAPVHDPLWMIHGPLYT